MNNTTEQEPEVSPFLELTIHHAQAVGHACVVVNDWAGKKGWNEPQTSTEAKTITQEIARIGVAHVALSNIVERIRKGGKTTETEEVLVAFLLQQVKGLSTEYIDEDKVEDICQVALMHTELSEAVEGIFFNSMDDKVTDFKSVVAELADCIIRIFHFCGRRALDLGGALVAKHAYNITRPWRHGKAK